MQNSGDIKHIQKYALYLLNIKMYTEKELQKKLFKKYPNNTSEIDTTIQLCKQNKFIDDVEYTRTYIQYRLSSSPQGKQKLIQELYKKGISPSISKDIIEEAQIDESTFAFEIAQKKWKTYNETLEPKKKSEKLYRFLASRGFSPEVTIQTVEKIKRS